MRDSEIRAYGDPWVQIAKLLIGVLGLTVLLCTGARAQDYRRFTWPDEDRDGLNTRHELLTARCIVLEASSRGLVRSAICLDQYTGKVIEGSARLVDIEHILPWRRVFFQIPAEHWHRLREIYADVDNLIITHRSLNRSKGAKSLSDFCPPLPASRQALARRVRIYTTRWSITLLPADEQGVSAWELGECA